jgi:hypothetical protein
MSDNLKYFGTYRAKVLSTDVSEEDQLGRIKVEVPPFLVGEDTAIRLSQTPNIVVEGIPLDDLPWCLPAYPLGTGSSVWTDENNEEIPIGIFVVPDVGSFVWVFFEGGDIYQPVYFAEAPTKTKGMATRRRGPEPDDEEKNHYPERRVIRFKRGIIIFDDHAVTDSQSDEEAVVAYEGDTGEGGGELIIRVKKDIHTIAEDSYFIEVGKDVSIKTRDQFITIADGVISVTGKKDITIHSDENITIDADGKCSITVDGDADITAQGDVNIVGDTVNFN